MDGTESKVTRYAEITAQLRSLMAEKEALKAELEEDYAAGASLSNGAQRIVVTYESRETFDHKEAMARGLFSPEEAEPFFKRSRYSKLSVKKAEVQEAPVTDDLRSNLARAASSLVGEGREGVGLETVVPVAHGGSAGASTKGGTPALGGEPK